MNLVNVRFIAAGMAMLIAAALASALKPAPASPDRRPNLERIIGPQFADWNIDPSVVPIPPSPDVQANLERIYNQLVSRTYVNGSGQRMMLTVAYADQQSYSSQKVHRQEVCYRGQGFTVDGLTYDSISVGQRQLPAIRMVATRGQRVEPVTYWFRTGRWVAHTHFGRFIGFLQGITGEVPDGMLVRVSNLSSDSSRSFALHDEFIRELLGSMAPQDTVHLVGIP